MALWIFLAPGGRTQTAQVPEPSVDAALGPCSVNFTVTNPSFHPLYNAQIHVHFRYGLWGTHHMNLQIGTNSAGKALVSGLPAKLRNPPLNFVITYQGALQDWYWTGISCTSLAPVVMPVH